MASIYQKGDKIYITWYDIKLQKRMNKSTGLTFSNSNWKQAQAIKKNFELALNKEKEKYKGLGIKKKTISDAFQHFLINNQTKHPKTIKDYMRFYTKFCEYFDNEKPCTILTKIKVESWLNEIKKLKLKRNTIFGYYKQLNHFLNFLFEYNYIPMFRINRDVNQRLKL